ncbi:Crp/Fnr family transcriptional regulator [Flavobacterium sp. LC2016-12]|uniref:Crp/Fnr family transcriptional regulator n=1 Tax=Flavobacterium sp. LC2016-12 TaxID=2783794 RepID=UPI00188AB4C3|nr:Crp/Fnr family transcriptional regulator [Flavobacterium sp. LC2016-12]MBF4464971.1 Crp/Fnr family transcriptional regulator [Flavobacterium sp. LC2016-12]
MSMQETLKEHINKIVQITPEEYEDIELYFYKQSYKKGKFLIESGKIAPYEFFILKGLVVSSHLNDIGKNHIVQFAGEGDWISDIKSFNTGCSNSIDIKCLEDTELYCISYEDKEKLCNSSKKMEYFFRKKSSITNVMLQKRILLFMCANSKDRYAQFIKDYPKIHLRVSKILIASYLGITRKTLSQI